MFIKHLITNYRTRIFITWMTFYSIFPYDNYQSKILNFVMLEPISILSIINEQGDFGVHPYAKITRKPQFIELITIYKLLLEN